MKSSKILFSCTLMAGTIITMSSSSWFSAWMGLEMNLLSFMPLLVSQNPQSSETAMKYFFMQAMGSMMIMFIMITPLLMQSNLILMSALAMKLGAAPFHFWLPQAIKGTNWLSASTLLSWQKMAPLSLMTFTKSNATTLIIMFSAMMGAWGGMNELRIKQLLAYSSINHMAWLLAMSYSSSTTTAFYLIMYTTLMFTMFSMVNKTTHLTQLWANTRSRLSTMMSLCILSLGGLPPLTGFVPKWMALNYILMTSKSMAVILVMSSMFLLYYYLRLTWISLTQSKTTHLHSPHMKTKTWFPLMITTSALPMIMTWAIL